MNKMSNKNAVKDFSDALKQTLEYIDNGNEADAADSAKRFLLTAVNGLLVAATDPDACCVSIHAYQDRPVKVMCLAVPPAEALYLMKEAVQHVMLELLPVATEGDAH